MKQILIALDDRCARDLDRVAPPKKRVRAEFIRLAIRSAIDLAMDRVTAAAYRNRPLGAGLEAGDLLGWDEHNELALPASGANTTLRGRRRAKPRTRKTSTKSAA